MHDRTEWIQRGSWLAVVAAAVCTAASGAEEGWRSLFDGETTAGWTTGGGQAVERGWVVEDGCLFRKQKGGDIYTVDTFEDFELEFEWKIAPGGNSGVKYRFKDGLGPEFQVLDDKVHPNGKNPLTSAGALYAMFPPGDQKVLKPIGEFNATRIVARGTKFEHWLNGKKVMEADTHSEAWAKAKAASKFKGKDGFGEGPGRIMLQDHGDAAWYRNIRIRVLK